MFKDQIEKVKEFFSDSDHELLKLSAKAMGLELDGQEDNNGGLYLSNHLTVWNPRDDDGDALRLSLKCRIEYKFSDGLVVIGAIQEPLRPKPNAALRRAILRAAAEIGKTLP